MNEPCDTDINKLDFLMERIKRLTPKQFDLTLDVNNKIFEAFALQKNEPTQSESK